MMSNLGKTIKTARKTKKITQRELAEKTNVNYTYISKLENDKTGVPPSEEMIDKLSKVLELNNKELKYLSGRISQEEKEILEQFIKVNYKQMTKFFEKMRNKDKQFINKLFS